MPRVKPPIGRQVADRPRVVSGVGVRIKSARLKVGLTQQQLAGDRYTKAYISALENSLVRPSVAALEYLAPRLGATAGSLLADAAPAWSRVDADLQLASGNWQVAADAYRDLLAAETVDRAARAELLLGLAEAGARLGNASESVAAASEAIDIFEALNRPIDTALANYWLSAGLYAQDNIAEAKSVLQATLAKVRMGLRVEPDFKLRLLMALSSNESREGNHEAALSYLSEVRSMADDLDDRRRAAYLFDLAYSYCETGDFEAAIRTGYAALPLFKAQDTSGNIARLENEIALAHLGTGNVSRADELASSAAARFAQVGDDRQRAHVLDTQAQIELARGNLDKASELAKASLELAMEVDNGLAASDALLTAARILAARATDKKSTASVKAAFDRALTDARESGRPQSVKRVLTEYADFLAASGDHKAAFELSREALASSR